MDVAEKVEETRGAAQRAAKRSKWVELLARIGYATKGFVYGLVGVLALGVAFGEGGKTTGSSGALRTLADESFGQLILWLVAVGLVGYVVWRFVQSVLDVEHEGTDGKAIVKRVGKFFSGLTYLFLAFTAARIAMGGGGGGGGGGGKKAMTAWLMGQPWGQWLVGLVGVVTLGLAAYQFYRAIKQTFREKLDLSALSSTARTWAVRLSRFGLSARGLVLALSGGFIVLAAWNANPSQAKGLDGALSELARQPWGSVLLGVVSLGLVAYGLYCGVQARYRTQGF